NSLDMAGEVTGPRECPVTGFETSPGRAAEQEQGDKLRLRPESFADHYSQARMFYRSLAEAEQAHVAFALVFELSKVGLEHIRVRTVANLVNVDPDLAQRVADGIGMPVPKASKAAAEVQDLDLSPALRIIDGPLEPQDIVGRSIAIFVADGSDAAAVAKMTKAIEGAGARAVIVAPKVGGAKMSDGSLLKADAQLAAYPSVMADAVVIALSKEGTAMLLKEGAAVQFVMDAFAHLKAIAASDEAQPLLDKAGVEPDDGVMGLDGEFIAAAAKRYWDREPGVRMLP
ncbi:MAG: catalase HPII, partial [Sphingomonadales bacterium]